MGQANAPDPAFLSAGYQRGQPRPDQVGFYQGQRLAGWGSRAGATLIDVLVLTGPMLVGAVIAGVAGGVQQAATGSSELTGVGGTIGGILTLTGIALGVYNVVFRQGRTGQTIGKRVQGIRLVRMDDGRPIGAGLVLKRHLVHWLDSLPLYAGWFRPLWDDRRQTFADKVVRTVVLAGPAEREAAPWYSSAGRYLPVTPWSRRRSGR